MVSSWGKWLEGSLERKPRFAIVAASSDFPRYASARLLLRAASHGFVNNPAPAARVQAGADVYTTTESRFAARVMPV